MEYSQGSTIVPDYVNWGGEIEQRREAILKGDVSAQDALNEAQQFIDSELGR
jgi:ABC-type glycerol-3-phosphate transport system substrate-binding protein